MLRMLSSYVFTYFRITYMFSYGNLSWHGITSCCALCGQGKFLSSHWKVKEILSLPPVAILNLGITYIKPMVGIWGEPVDASTLNFFVNFFFLYGITVDCKFQNCIVNTSGDMALQSWPFWQFSKLLKIPSIFKRPYLEKFLLDWAKNQYAVVFWE